MSLPVNGQTIIFSTIPAGSYCSEGVAYRVERSIDRRTKLPKGSFRFVRVGSESSTYDQPWAVKMALWEIAA